MEYPPGVLAESVTAGSVAAVVAGLGGAGAVVGGGTERAGGRSLHGAAVELECARGRR